MVGRVISFPVILAGLGFGLSLIVAIGAQNAFVLRQGLKREHVGILIAICIASDVILISAGIAGFGVVVAKAPWVIPIVTFFGVSFLFWYAMLAFRRAIRPEALDVDAPDLQPTPVVPAGSVSSPDVVGDPALEGGQSGLVTPGATTGTAVLPMPIAAPAETPVAVPKPRMSSRRAVIIQILIVTYLNPHVYLDTLVLMGSVASTYGSLKWNFAIGAFMATITWFFALGFGSRVLTPIFRRPSAWRVLDALIGLMMLFLATKLAVELFHG